MPEGGDRMPKNNGTDLSSVMPADKATVLLRLIFERQVFDLNLTRFRVSGQKRIDNEVSAILTGNVQTARGRIDLTIRVAFDLGSASTVAHQLEVMAEGPRTNIHGDLVVLAATYTLEDMPQRRLDLLAVAARARILSALLTH